MLATHLDAERRYNDLRLVAYETAQMGAAPGVRFTGITADALTSARSWASSPIRQVAWDWFDGYSAFRFRYPKRFELALWSANRLMALSLGRPTYNGNHLRLDLVEAQPRDLGPRPPVLPDILVAYIIYARLMDARQIRIMHPINEDVTRYYESFGYRYIASGDYLFREVP